MHPPAYYGLLTCIFLQVLLIFGFIIARWTDIIDLAAAPILAFANVIVVSFFFYFFLKMLRQIDNFKRFGRWE